LEDFAFVLKLPGDITHERQLGDAEETLDRFPGKTAAPGAEPGPLLVQPPSLAFGEGTVRLPELRAGRGTIARGPEGRQDGRSGRDLRVRVGDDFRNLDDRRRGD
jgi:hypothetical protein